MNGLNTVRSRLITGSVLVMIGLSAWSYLSSFYFASLLFCIMLYILAVEWPRFALWWMTLFYPITPLLALIHLYLCDPRLWLWLVIVVAAYDTGAYFTGKLYGSIKIAPAISPGKTVQGLAGGVLFSMLFGLLCAHFLIKTYNFSILIICLLGICIGLLAFFGDLFESYLKRLAGLKDSGAILPGHGGILDRIDGLLLTALVIDIAFKLLGYI